MCVCVCVISIVLHHHWQSYHVQSQEQRSPKWIMYFGRGPKRSKQSKTKQLHSRNFSPLVASSDGAKWGKRLLQWWKLTHPKVESNWMESDNGILLCFLHCLGENFCTLEYYHMLVFISLSLFFKKHIESLLAQIRRMKYRTRDWKQFLAVC